MKYCLTALQGLTVFVTGIAGFYRTKNSSGHLKARLADIWLAAILRSSGAMPHQADLCDFATAIHIARNHL